MILAEPSLHLVTVILKVPPAKLKYIRPQKYLSLSLVKPGHKSVSDYLLKLHHTRAQCHIYMS